MEFLYLGSKNERLNQLKQALNRSQIVLEQTDTPEYAFFKIVHKEIQGLFLDLTEPGFDGEELIGSFQSIGEEFELVLITEPEKINGFDANKLRFCFGYVTPNLTAPHNMMVLNQLTEKVLIKDRLERFRHSSILDGLTQLHNHAHFQQQLSEEIALRAPMREAVSLVLFDIDHFKNYNDTNGHPAGDGVLKKIAKMLDNAVRKIDFTARYGGEEFVIIFPGVSLKTALKVTERFRRKIAETDFEFGHRQPLGFVSASFGVACLDYKTVTGKADLINQADQALLKAKQHRRNCIWYHLGDSYHHYQGSLP